MNKYVLSLLFLLLASYVFGQKKTSLLILTKSETAEYTKVNGKTIGKVYKGVFQQDYSTLSSDSAYFYPDLNMVDAFGHVNINQGDTLNIYSDKLNYNGNTKVAILTDHVIMVDKDATLTTNYFTYNTATRIGTYTGGGKLVNKDNTLVSKNGYYFAFTRDEYFRYDVVCTTPDAVIKTDTLRYNSGSRIAYFYGPTHIYGKDKDVLYTENGTYNTTTEQAFFGKNNLYTQQTKTLKGDSLFYDRLKGYGRATKNVVFNDSEQKATVKGDLGEYYKADERTVMTQNPYMIFVTQDSTTIKPANKKQFTDSLLKNNKLTDSVLNKNAGAFKIKPITNNKLTLQGIADSVTKKVSASQVAKMVPNKLTLQGITDSVTKKISPQAIAKLRQKKPIALKTAGLPDKDKAIKEFAKTTDSVRRDDSLFLTADTIETQVITYKALKVMQQKQYDAAHRDTSIKAPVVKKSIVYTKAPKVLTLDPPSWPLDTSFIHHDFFGKPKPPAPKVLPKITKVKAPKKTAQDSLKEKRVADSIALTLPKVLSDTSRIRIINAHYKAKLFKADLQAKADSMFYSNSDSTIRCYTNPIIWTQGSQLSGDTINLQMKNRKLDNMDMYPSAFIVNIEKNDSLHFNQAGGKTLHGTFKNNKLNSILIVGNAETIYFKRDTVKNEVTDMSRTVSGKIRAIFDKGEMDKLWFYGNYENHILPINKATEEDKVLKGFIWKPKERPLSKESILSSFRKKPAVKAPANKPSTVKKIIKPGLKNISPAKAPTDTSATQKPMQMGRDSTARDTGKATKPVLIK